jgi:hypothetical protein
LKQLFLLSVNEMMNRIILNILLIICPFVYAQSQCLGPLNAFQPGEKLFYQAYYNWGFIWVHAGDVVFSVSSKPYQSKMVYYFETTGNSLKSYDWMYKVRERFQSYVDRDKFQPLWAERSSSEGGYKAYEQYTFSPSGKKIISVTENSKRPLAKDTLNSKQCTFDVLSAIYFCRTINFENHKIDEKIPINTVIDNELYSLYLRYKGKETIKTKDNKYYKCIKFSALLVGGTIFKGGEDMFIWVTDDANRIPVLVEAKILIGSVKAYIIKAEGLRNQQTALVKGR